MWVPLADGIALDSFGAFFGHLFLVFFSLSLNLLIKQRSVQLLTTASQYD